MGTYTTSDTMVRDKKIKYRGGHFLQTHCKQAYNNNYCNMSSMTCSLSRSRRIEANSSDFGLDLDVVFYQYAQNFNNRKLAVTSRNEKRFVYTDYTMQDSKVKRKSGSTSGFRKYVKCCSVVICIFCIDGIHGERNSEIMLSKTSRKGAHRAT